MSKIATALNRFGLGGTNEQAASMDPPAWLEGQLARFDPRPSPIAAAKGTAELVTMLREARDDRRERKDEAKAAGADPKAREQGEAGPFRDLRDAYSAAVGTRTDVALASVTPFVERLVHF